MNTYWDHFDNFVENLYFDTFENDTFDSVWVDTTANEYKSIFLYWHSIISKECYKIPKLNRKNGNRFLLETLLKMTKDFALLMIKIKNY